MKPFIRICLLTVFVLSACGKTPTPTAAPTTGNAPTNAEATNPPATGKPATAPATEAGSAPTTDSPASPTGTTSAGSASSSSCSDSAAFVSDVTVQDNSIYQPGDTFKKVWRVRNTGTCEWSSGYTLVFHDGNQMSAPDSTPLQDTKPGDTLDIGVSMTAPSNDKVYRADFEIHAPDGNAIPIDQSTILWVIINVISDSSEVHNTSGTGGVTTNSGPGFATVTCAYTTDQAKLNDMLTALNAYRAQSGLVPYKVNSQLNQAAQAHANDMACNKLFYHNGSNGSTPKSRVDASDYVASYVTENVYGSYPPLSGAGVVSWWATDQTDLRHNENLLSTKYVDIGIGYAFYNNFGYYVIDFATP